MRAARAQLEKATATRCRIRDRQELAPVPYTEREIELFSFSIGAALSRPGAFDRICDRIADLLKNARARS